jgi:integration host factor subunit alpha
MKVHADRKKTLTKEDIVNSVIDNVRFKNKKKTQQQFLFPEMNYLLLSRQRATRIVNTLFETIKENLTEGDDIRIKGFGKFQVKFKWARTGRNPQTGEKIILRSRRIVTFRASPKLKKKMNPIEKRSDPPDHPPPPDPLP